MPAFMIAEIEVRDPETYAEYTRQASEVVERYGGRYLVCGGQTIPLSGDWLPERLIVIEFPSTEQVQRCFQSEEYQRIAPLREASTRSRAVLVEGAQPADCK